MRLALLTLLIGACLFAPGAFLQAEDKPATKQPVKWKPLFNGKSLENWKVTNFGGEGEVTVEDGAISLDYGSSLTGVTYKGEFPKMNYELHVVAQRAEGSDFFAGITFPVGEAHCSLIPGGWGGTVLGISSIDGYDASENGTTQYVNIKQKKWYDIRIRVTPAEIAVWLDGKQVIDQELKDRKLSVRPEVELSRPLGICTFETLGLIRTVEYRKLKPKAE